MTQFHEIPFKKACVNTFVQIEKSQGEILCNLVVIEKKNDTVFPNSKCLKNSCFILAGSHESSPLIQVPPPSGWVASLLWAAASPAVTGGK